MIKIFVSTVLVLCTLSARAGDSVPDTSSAGVVSAVPDDSSELAVWNRANDAYARGEFRAAIDGYNSLLSAGRESAKLYYNLGGAYFKCDSIAEAIVSYNRALALDPSDADAAYNLSVAEARTVNRIDVLPEFFVAGWFRNISRIMGSDGWAVVSVLFFALMLAGGVWYLLASTVGRRKAGFTVSAVSLVMFVVSVCVATSQKRDKIRSRRAVVMVTAAAVKSSPGVSGKDLFVLNEGACVSLGDKVGDWRQITIASGDKGWILSEQIEEI